MNLLEFPEGVTESFPSNITGDVFGGHVSFDITEHTDPKIEIEIQIWLSNDNANTWDFGGSTKRKGGIAINPTTKKIETQASFGSFISNPSYHPDNKFDKYVPKWQNPLIKTITIITGGKLNTKVTPDIISSIAIQGDMPDLHHSIAYVQSVQAYSSSTSPITTAAITTTTGNLIVLDNYYYEQGAGLTNSDSKTNVWTNSIANYGTVVFGIENYNASIAGGASHTFTATSTQNITPYMTITATEISGHAASPFDKSGTKDDASGTSHSTSATGTLSQAAELIIGMGGCGNPGTLSVSAPWNQIQNVSHDGTREGQVVAYQIVSATTSLTFDWTTSASVIAGGHISTWKEAAGGGYVGVVSTGFPTLLTLGVG